MESEEELLQFKTIEDLRDKIDALIKEHRNAKANKLGIMFRVVIPPNSETTYVEGHQGPYDLAAGVRVCDYKFEASSGLNWVIPDRSKGLSFSKSFSHLKNTRKMLGRHARGLNKPGPANVAWWILSKCDIPPGLEFIQDPKNKHHYFLAVTERMHIRTLVERLKLIACHMTTMKDIFFGE